jgi:RNA polymerase sigma-70 factor (ECF subfamily)
MTTLHAHDTMTTNDKAGSVVELRTRSRPADEELVRQGFDAIYAVYVPYVASIGHKLLGRPEEVEDLVQDVFVQVLLHLDQLEEPAALRGWLGMITTRKALGRLRKRNLRRLVGLDDYEGYVNARYQGVTPHDSALLSEVFAYLDGLPARTRIIWCWSHLAGKNNPEIAKLCGCSVATVKRGLASARALLAQEFGDD